MVELNIVSLSCFFSCFVFNSPVYCLAFVLVLISFSENSDFYLISFILMDVIAVFLFEGPITFIHACCERKHINSILMEVYMYEKTQKVI